MWGKRKSSDEAAKQQAFKNRLDAVLGLDHSELAGREIPFDNHGTAGNGAGELVSVAVASSRGDGAGSHDENSRPEDVNAYSGNGGTDQFSAGIASGHSNGNGNGKGRGDGVPGETLYTNLPESNPGAQEDDPAADVVRLKESELAEWREQCEKALESHSRQFQERLARVAEEAYSQAQANAQGIVSRLERCLAQAEEAKSGIEATLAGLSAKGRETADAQTGVLEATFATFTGRIGAVDEMLTGRVDEYRAQIEELKSSLELALSNFSQRTQEAVQVQAQAFGQEVGRIAQQTLGQAEDNIDNRIAKLQEGATRSLEEQITGLAEQVRNSQSEAETLLAKVQGSRLQYGSEIDSARRSIGELHQKGIESALKTLKSQAGKEIEALTAKASQEIRDQIRSEAAAAASEFVEQEGRARIQQAFHGSYEKFEQDLSARLQNLFSENQQLTLDQLRTKSQELGAEFIKQIQRRCEERLEQAGVTLDDGLRTQAERLRESAESLSREIEAGLQENLQAWSKAHLEAVHQQANIESAVDALSDQAAKEIKALTASVSQEVRDRVWNEAAAATSEFIEQEGRTRIQHAFHDVYQSCEQDLSSSGQLALDDLQAKSQELGAELIKQIQSRGEESLAKATTALDEKLRVEVQANVESALEALKGQAAKEIEALTASVSQEIRDQFRKEAAAASSEFIEQEGRTRIQQAFQESYEKCEQDLIARFQDLSSDGQPTLDGLRAKSQELGAELIEQIRSRGEESLAKATTALDEKLRAEVQANVESALEALKGQAAKEIETLTTSVSQEVRGRVRNEAAAATREFIEQEGRTYLREAFHESYEKQAQDQSSERQLALDDLRAKSQGLGAELIKQIQSRAEESLAKAATSLDENLRAKVQANVESALEALKGQAAKEVEALTASLSQEVRGRVRNEAAAATKEFIEQEGRTRLREAFDESYEKHAQDLSSERQLALDDLQAKSQELGAELVGQIQGQGEESVAKATAALQEKLRAEVQANVESALEALKGQAAKEVEALTVSVSQEIRDQFRKEAAAASSEFIEQEGRARTQQAFNDSYEKFEQDLAARFENLSSQSQQMTLDHLRTKSQELGAELIRQIQSRCDDSLKKAVVVLDDRLRAQTKRLKESGESLDRDIGAGLRENMQAWSKAHLESLQQQANGILAEVLSRMRAESDTIAQGLEARLPSEPGRPKTRTTAGIQEKPQIIKEELPPSGRAPEASTPAARRSRLWYWAGALTLGAVLGWIGIATDPHGDTSAAPFTAAIQVWGDIAPTWSPDDKDVIYCDRRQDERKLYSVSVSKGEPRLFLRGQSGDCMTAWSPDGARLAFSSSQRGKFQLVSALGLAHPLNIWTVSASGSDPRQLTNSSASLSMHWFVDPSWSPDGAQIAFTAYPGPRVMTVPASGGDAQVFANGFSPAWSPDGTRLAYLSHEPEQPGTRLSVFVQSAQDGETKRLTSFTVKSDFLFRPSLDWSPDGERLLTVEPKNGQWQPAIIKTADGKVERTVPVPGSVVDPRWSHDGKRIAYGLTESGHPAKIEVLTLATEERAELTHASYPSDELDSPQERPQP
ncbi:MAG TPA: hypothetical protein VGZ29_08505 [Terriglobia bacterium]|nr:hypothetical protein [Terriglobia bacterium]